MKIKTRKGITCTADRVNPNRVSKKNYFQNLLFSPLSVASRDKLKFSALWARYTGGFLLFSFN